MGALQGTAGPTTKAPTAAVHLAATEALLVATVEEETGVTAIVRFISSTLLVSVRIRRAATPFERRGASVSHKSGTLTCRSFLDVDGGQSADAGC